MSNLKGTVKATKISGKLNTSFNVVDQTYDPTSENAQSGKAVAEAIANIDIPESGGADIDTSLFASAIQNQVSGSVISVNDVGALDHTVKVKLSGEEVENLLPSPYTEPFSMHTYNGDGSLVINGFVPSDNYMPLIVYFSYGSDTLEKGTYTLDLGTATNQVYLEIALTDANNSPYENYQTDNTGKITFTVGDFNVIETLLLRAKSNETINNLLVKPMFYKVNSIASSYTSVAPQNYDPSYETALRIDCELKSSTQYTIKFKANMAGVVLKTEAAITENHEYTYIETTGAEQTLTFTTIDVIEDFASYYDKSEGGWGVLRYENYTDTSFKLTDVTIVEGNGVATDYTKVKLYRYGANSNIDKVEYTPNADGTVEVDSLAPYMSLVTDKCGLTIEATYNIDTKGYIDKKFEELKALFS